MPSLPSALARRHLGWPVLLLLLGLAVTIATVVQAQRAAAAQRRATERLLGEYAEFAAWSYPLHVQQRLRTAATNTLGPVLHPQPHELPGWPRAFDLVAYHQQFTDACRCDPAFAPATYVAWSLGGGETTVAGARLAPALLDALRDTTVAAARAGRMSPERLGLLAATIDDTLLVAAFGLMPMARGDTMLYAFTYDAASLQRGFAAAVADGVLPPSSTGGRPATDLFVLRVATADGRPLFATADASAASDGPYLATHDLSVAMGALRTSVTLRPESVGLLGAGSAGPSPLVLLALASLAVGLTALAVRQLRRESELARSRADFVASVSHELRTPLAQMRLFLETLRLGRYRTDEQRSWLLGHVERETTRLGHLVENVLAFARVGRADSLVAGQPATPTDVGDEAAEVLAGFAPLAELHGTHVELEVAEPIVAPLHRAAFRQLLLNLLDNAVKYGPRGGTVRVRVARATDATVQLSVRDEGPGVPPEERDRIWLGFQRGALARRLGVGGSGIGLALVREIARAHGGEARLAAAVPGETGARFVVELPAAAAPPASPSASVAAPSPAAVRA